MCSRAICSLCKERHKFLVKFKKKFDMQVFEDWGVYNCKISEDGGDKQEMDENSTSIIATFNCHHTQAEHMVIDKSQKIFRKK